MIIYLYGEDTYSANNRLGQYKEKFQQQYTKSGLDIVSFDSSDFSLEKLNSALGQAGFFAKTKLVIVTNPSKIKLNETAKKGLEELLEKQTLSQNPLIFLEEGLPDKRLTIIKKIIQLAEPVEEFKLLEKADLDKWLKKYLADNALKLEAKAVTELLEITGNNLWRLKQELDKLAAYKKNEMITEADIALMVAPKISDNIFNLTDALARGDKKTAYKILNNQLKVGQAPQQILAMIIWQFRTLAMIVALAEKNYREAEIATQTKINPYTLRRNLPLAKKFSLEKIKRIYRLLVWLDKKFKSTRLDPESLIDTLIARI